METEGKLRLAEVFVSISDSRQAGKVEHDLVELLVVAVNAVLVGADTFVEFELWAKEKLDWLRGYLKLKAGIPSHDTFGRLFGLIDPTSLAPDADRLLRTIRAHWSIENRLHWCMDVVFADDQMRARTGHAAHNLAVLKHITLNLIRLDPIPRKGGIKARRLIAATSDSYRALLLGLT
ncbi:MAG: ISAs1 family transposase [Betaproteobacteria bacterium]|nr:ISAs1 family transposase [Betaproteobacteria bacterium]